jgi:oligopeptide transport system permease protein
MMRFVDILYALPFTIFVILLMVAFGRSLWLMFVAIGCVEWLSMARIVRSGVIALRKQEFIEAAVSLGYSHRRIILGTSSPTCWGR